MQHLQHFLHQDRTLFLQLLVQTLVQCNQPWPSWTWTWRKMYGWNRCFLVVPCSSRLFLNVRSRKFIFHNQNCNALFWRIDLITRDLHQKKLVLISSESWCDDHCRIKKAIYFSILLNVLTDGASTIVAGSAFPYLKILWQKVNFFNWESNPQPDDRKYSVLP